MILKIVSLYFNNVTNLNSKYFISIFSLNFSLLYSYISYLDKVQNNDYNPIHKNGLTKYHSCSF